MKTYIILLAVFLVSACSQEQASTAAQNVGKTYNETYRDNVIKNWQTRVVDDARCSSFKQRFHDAGVRHESAVTGIFVNDMMKIMGEVKKAGCEYKP